MQDLMARQRPLGVTIIAVLAGIQGVFLLIIGILTFLGIFAGHAVGAALAIAGTITIIIALLTLFFAWGLWTLKKWAFWAIVIIEVINVINGIIAIVQGRWTNWIGLILSVVILIYFLADSHVREAFQT